MSGIKHGKSLKISGNIAQGGLITIPVTGVGFNKCFGCLATKHMFFNQFFHNLAIFCSQLFVIQFSKENIFFLAMVSPIGIYPDEINCFINEHGIYLVFQFDFG